MSGLNMTLDIAKGGMQAQQTALTVIGHNIVNVNSPGFSKQTVLMVPNTALPSDVGLLGSGVSVDSITRAYSKYIQSQLSGEIEGFGKWEAKRETLDQIEAIFNESADYGLNNAMNEFWNSWQDVANNPTGQAERITLISKGATLVNILNDQHTNLSQIQDGLNNTIGNTLEDINTMADQIAELNQKILGAESGGCQANDYRDERLNLVNDLSALINVNYFETSDGSLTIMVGEGKSLVEGISSWDLEGEVNIGNNGFIDVTWNPGGTSSNVNISNDITGGKLAGWLDLRDTTIDDYLDKLNTLAGKIIEEVNRLHSDGVGLSGYSSITAANAVSDTGVALENADLPFTPVDGSFDVYVYDSSGTITDSGTITIDADVTTLNNVDTQIDGINNITASINNGQLTITADNGYTFSFLNDDSDALPALGLNTFFTGSDASTIAINPVVEDDVSMIAAATSTNSPGDNTNALAIADLENSLLLGNGTYTFNDYYNSLVSEIGMESQNASSMSSHQELMVEQMENQRSSVSGVSLDEEMVNLIKYQNAYVASTRLVSLIDELLQTLVEMV